MSLKHDRNYDSRWKYVGDEDNVYNNLHVVQIVLQALIEASLDIYPPRERGDLAPRGSSWMLRVIMDTSRPRRDIGTFVTCVGGFGEGFRGSLPSRRGQL
jgi:hypothetical protein